MCREVWERVFQTTAHGVQLQVQPWRGGAGHVECERAAAAEQSPEELVPRGQSCRLELTNRFAGRFGTVPMTGNTNAGNTE